MFQTPPQTCLILTNYCRYYSKTTIHHFNTVSWSQCFHLSHTNHVNVLPKVSTFLLKITNEITYGRLLNIYTIKKIWNEYLNVHTFQMTSIIFQPNASWSIKIPTHFLSFNFFISVSLWTLFTVQLINFN